MTTNIITTTAPTTLALRETGRRLALAVGLLSIAMAIFQVAVPGAPDGASYDTFADYTREFLFLGFLLGTIGAVEIARRDRLAPERRSLLITAGYGLIAIGVIIGLIVREELDWFFVLAGPGLLLSAVGYILWAIWAHKSRTMPTWAATLLAIGGITAIIMSELGTSVLIGSFWLYLANKPGDDTERGS